MPFPKFLERLFQFIKNYPKWTEFCGEDNPNHVNKKTWRYVFKYDSYIKLEN